MSETTEIVEKKDLTKVKLVFDEPELKTFKFNKQTTITVFPYLKVNDKSTLISEYLNALYGDLSVDLEIRYVVAQYAVMMRVIDTVTNIEIEDLDPDLVIYSDLYKEITSRISNYAEFLDELEKVRKIYQEELSNKNAVGTVVQGLANKLEDVLENISKMDADAIRQASKEFSDNLKQLNESVPGIVGGSKSASVEVPAPKAKRTRTKKAN